LRKEGERMVSEGRENERGGEGERKRGKGML